MSEQVAVRVQDLKKSFLIPTSKKRSLFDHLRAVVTGDFRKIEKKVLNGVSFDIKKGECFGVIGRNGTGKSTLLQIISGVLFPDSGTVTVHGSIIPLLRLGVGFQKELTAHDNVLQYGLLLGFSRQEMEEKYDEIFRFAELEQYQNLQLKNFSSGMRVRLAFSIAIQVIPDIVILDEVLSVGDESFKEKSNEKIMELRYSGKTVILVSHNMRTIQSLCDRCMYLNNGEVGAIGKPDDVIENYISSIVTDRAEVFYIGRSRIQEQQERTALQKRETDLFLQTADQIMHSSPLPSAGHPGPLSPALSLAAERFLSNPQIISETCSLMKAVQHGAEQRADSHPVTGFIDELTTLGSETNDSPLKIIFSSFPDGFLFVTNTKKIQFRSDTATLEECIQASSQKIRIVLLISESSILPVFIDAKELLHPDIVLFRKILSVATSSGFTPKWFFITSNLLNNPALVSVIDSDIPYVIVLNKKLIREPDLITEIRKTRRADCLMQYDDHPVFYRASFLHHANRIIPGHIIIDPSGISRDLRKIYRDISNLKNQVARISGKNNLRADVLAHEFIRSRPDIFTAVSDTAGMTRAEVHQEKVTSLEESAGAMIYLSSVVPDPLSLLRWGEIHRRLSHCIQIHQQYISEEEPAVRGVLRIQMMREALEMGILIRKNPAELDSRQ